MRAGEAIRRGCLPAALIGLALVAESRVAVLAAQGQRKPPARADYVALGSSYAAGAGLGRLQPGSPLLCARSVNGYPQQLARLRGLAIADMTCGGATARHVLRGGQFFQGPQIRAVNETTRLVTLTVGGNDIGYIGDLSLLAARKDRSLFGWLARHLWQGPKPLSERGFARLGADLAATLHAIHKRAPRAVVIVVTYPTALPPTGTCRRIALTEPEVRLMRQVSDRLADTTRQAAENHGSRLVDMNRLGADHHACAASPWVSGWKDAGIATFHPTLAGAGATAASVSKAIDRPGR